MNKSNIHQRIDIIQYMRGVASVMVLLYHGSIFLGPYGKGIGGVLFGPAGDMGVDLFFVISGFIMVHATKNSHANFEGAVRFSINRITRVLPLYLICSVAAYLILNRFDNAGISTERLIYSLLFIPYKIGYGPVYGWPALNVGWTLNYEIYFYFIFALSMLFGRLRYFALFLTLLSIIYLVPILSGMKINTQVATSYGFDLNYLNLATNPIILLFLSGVIIGLIYKSNLILGGKLSLILCSLSLIGVVLQYTLRFNVSHGINQWGISIVPFVFAFVMASKKINFANIKPLSYLGDISFSLYLIHPIVIPFNIDFVRLIGLGEYQKGFISLSVYVIVSTVISVFVHKFIEKPASNISNNALKKAISLTKFNKVKQDII